jgi:hypothetical protein
LLYQGIFEQIDEGREDVGGYEREEGIESVIHPLHGFVPFAWSDRNGRVLV